LSPALVVAGKEFRAYFKTPVAYVFLFVFLALTGGLFLFVPNYFVFGQASLRGFFEFLPWIFLLLGPAVAMKLWAEERKVGTIETLLTLPLRDHQIVLGKFLAAVGLIAVALLLTFPLPLIVVMTAAGPVDLGPILGSYLGALCLGAAYVAISLFASALTRSQIVAFILGVGMCLALVLVGFPPVMAAFPRGLAQFLAQVSLLEHFAGIAKGVVDSRDVLYYLSVLAFFLVLNVAAVRRR
jgi:ABC-2 type transport system permease protein